MCLPLNKRTSKTKYSKKQNTQLEEENQTLKKAITIFTPHSNKD